MLRGVEERIGCEGFIPSLCDRNDLERKVAYLFEQESQKRATLLSYEDRIFERRFVKRTAPEEQETRSIPLGSEEEIADEEERMEPIPQPLSSLNHVALAWHDLLFYLVRQEPNVKEMILLLETFLRRFASRGTWEEGKRFLLALERFFTLQSLLRQCYFVSSSFRSPLQGALEVLRAYDSLCEKYRVFDPCDRPPLFRVQKEKLISLVSFFFSEIDYVKNNGMDIETARRLFSFFAATPLDRAERSSLCSALRTSLQHSVSSSEVITEAQRKIIRAFITTFGQCCPQEVQPIRSLLYPPPNPS